MGLFQGDSKKGRGAFGHVLPSGVIIQSGMLGPRLAAFIFGTSPKLLCGQVL